MIPFRQPIHERCSADRLPIPLVVPHSSEQSCHHAPRTQCDFLQLYADIYEQYEKYIMFQDEENYHIMTIWCLGTYMHQLFTSFPYILLHGQKGTGKTKTLTIASYICFNAILAGSLSPADLFRTVREARPTLLIDEAETLDNKDAAEMFRTLLLNGYKKSGKIRRRGTSEENFKSQRTRCASVLFFIQRLDRFF